MRLKVVVMCCDGLYQYRLMQRLADEFDLVGIILHSTPYAKGSLLTRLLRYVNPLSLGRYLLARILMLFYQKKADPLIRELFFVNGSPPEIPRGIPLLRIADINTAEAVEFVRRLSPSIVCVNGTNLLRKPMLDLVPTIPYGIINLHTGLSPYSRGGNCNLFMLLEGHPELVGITIHYIDQGIDSGDIILTARPDMDVDDNYEMIDAKTFHLGIESMIRAVRQIINNSAQRVKQWEKGKLFLKRTGYVYSPFDRVHVNRLLKKGLISEYLADRHNRDAAIRLIREHT